MTRHSSLEKPFFRFLPISCIYLLLIAITLLSSSSCRQSVHRSAKDTDTSPTPSFSKTEVKHARGFDIEYGDGYKILKIFSYIGPKVDTTNYLLKPRGKAAPEDYRNWNTIEIPVKRLFGMSSLQIAMADFVESPDIIAGFSNLIYVSSPRIRANIDNGKVKEIGEDGSLNIETIIAEKPDVLLTTAGIKGGTSPYQSILNAGIPVLAISEWLENTPLGRAEWVKVMAALVNKEELVNRKFAEIEKEYTRLASLGRNTSSKPEIIVGMPYKGSWFVPDGTSYMTRLFKDAGASYNWYEVKGV